VGDIRMDADWACRLLPLVADGLSNAAIGRQLNLTESTVKHYLMLLYAWLGALNRAHSVAIGYARGFIPADVAIGITDDAVAVVAKALGITDTEAECALMAGVPCLRLVPVAPVPQQRSRSHLDIVERLAQEGPVKAPSRAVDGRTPASGGRDTGDGRSTRLVS
jgi:hypothetical protein